MKQQIRGGRTGATGSSSFSGSQHKQQSEEAFRLPSGCTVLRTCAAAAEMGLTLLAQQLQRRKQICSNQETETHKTSKERGADRKQGRDVSFPQEDSVI